MNRDTDFQELAGSNYGDMPRQPTLAEVLATYIASVEKYATDLSAAGVLSDIKALMRKHQHVSDEG